MKNLKDGIIGLSIGDALGVPVEFYSREELDENPVIDMQAYGTYNQPKGTWSDDSSLTFCLAEVLTKEYNLTEIAKSFIDWKTKGKWTAHDEVFDIGIQTEESIDHLIDILNNNDFEALHFLKLENDEYANGNGSLMRILPLYYEIEQTGIENSFLKIHDVSALTHGHIRSAIACMIYLIMIDELMKGKNKEIAYENTRKRSRDFFDAQSIPKKEINHFNRLIQNDISELKRSQINSTGYVIHSLEASFWCLLKCNTFSETVLEAVNLGEDTDTTGAISGGMAGILYGINSFPTEWVSSVVRLDDISNLCDALDLKYEK